MMDNKPRTKSAKTPNNEQGQKRMNREPKDHDKQRDTHIKQKNATHKTAIRKMKLNIN